MSNPKVSASEILARAIERRCGEAPTPGMTWREARPHVSVDPSQLDQDLSLLSQLAEEAPELPRWPAVAPTPVPPQRTAAPPRPAELETLAETPVAPSPARPTGAGESPSQAPPARWSGRLAAADMPVVIGPSPLAARLVASEQPPERAVETARAPDSADAAARSASPRSDAGPGVDAPVAAELSTGEARADPSSFAESPTGEFSEDPSVSAESPTGEFSADPSVSAESPTREFSADPSSFAESPTGEFELLEEDNDAMDAPSPLLLEVSESVSPEAETGERAVSESVSPEAVTGELEVDTPASEPVAPAPLAAAPGPMQVVGRVDDDWPLGGTLERESAVVDAAPVDDAGPSRWWIAWLLAAAALALVSITGVGLAGMVAAGGAEPALAAVEEPQIGRAHV